MIRVILRDLIARTGEGALIGDFPPDHIDALVNLIRSTSLYRLSDSVPLRLAADIEGGPLQWVYTDDMPPRLLLEILVESVDE